MGYENFSSKNQRSTNIRDIFEAYVIPFPEFHRLLLMQNNAPAHITHATMAYLQEYNVNCTVSQDIAQSERLGPYAARTDGETTGSEF